MRSSEKWDARSRTPLFHVQPSGCPFIPHRKSGSLCQVIPGGRILWIVTRKLRPVKIELNPSRKTPAVAAMTAVLLPLVE